MNTPHDLAWARQIDWSQPWMQPWRAIGEPLQAAILAGTPLWDALNTGEGAPVRFVAPCALDANAAYELFIQRTGTCPVRCGQHDFFNGLCWLRFPRSKRRLNTLQCEQIDQFGVGAARGAVRDALTLFDENAALLRAPDSLWAALLRKDWRSLFGELRPQWQDAQLQLFGHALLEKLQQPRKAVTAHVYRVECVASDQGALDRWLATSLCSASLADKPFATLPLLGVPGWWRANLEPDFYDDPSVFRPAKVRLVATQ